MLLLKYVVKNIQTHTQMKYSNPSAHVRTYAELHIRTCLPFEFARETPVEDEVDNIG